MCRRHVGLHIHKRSPRHILSTHIYARMLSCGLTHKTRDSNRHCSAPRDLPQAQIYRRYTNQSHLSYQYTVYTVYTYRSPPAPSLSLVQQKETTTNNNTLSRLFIIVDSASSRLQKQTAQKTKYKVSNGSEATSACCASSMCCAQKDAPCSNDGREHVARGACARQPSARAVRGVSCSPWLSS